jgi:hypothetical protein
MKTEQEIKEKLAYWKGYRDGGLVYGISADDDAFARGQIKALEWVLEVE